MAASVLLTSLGHPAVFWASLVVISAGVCLHRMGPAFNRSRFGPPLAFLGIATLLLPNHGTIHPEGAVYDSISDSLPWLTAALVGSLLVLRGAPTYGSRRNIELAAGWGFISLSLYASISEFSSIVFGEILHGIFAMAGLLSGLAIFLAGIWVSERFSTIDNESEPLSQDEEALVRTILSRRIGGDLDGN